MNEGRDPAPRRLYQDRENKVVFGVCAGVADYFGLDVAVTRVVVLACLVFFLPPTLIGYIVLALLLPKKPSGISGRIDPADVSLQRTVRSSPQATLDTLRHRFRELDGRTQRLEKYLTSKRFELDREFAALKD
jgi:phage shock protein C